MSRRKKLSEIQQQFELAEPQPPQNPGSLTEQLSQPKKKAGKIRFTLDLERDLDKRLSSAAKHLNRSKADLTRVALERLLEELENEWSSR